MEPRPEGVRRRQVVHVSQPEDVLVLGVAQRAVVHVQQPAGRRQARLDQQVVGLRGSDLVEVVEGALLAGPGFDVLESRSQRILADLDELVAVLDPDVALLELLLEEGVA